MKKNRARSEAAKRRWAKARELRAAFDAEHPLVSAFLDLPQASRRRIAEALLAGLVTDANVSTDTKITLGLVGQTFTQAKSIAEKLTTSLVSEGCALDSMDVSQDPASNCSITLVVDSTNISLATIKAPVDQMLPNIPAVAVAYEPVDDGDE